MKKPKLPKLIPPDRKQCQAEMPNGCTFMSLGGRPGMVRCTKKPTVISKENKPGADGRRGSMSLCDDCAKVMVQQLGASYATMTPIRARQ